MSRREQILAMAGFVLVVAVSFFYGVYQPQQAEYQRLIAERETLQAELDRMEATVRNAKQLEREYLDLQSFIATVEAKLPARKEISSLLVQLERLTGALGIDFAAIRPGVLAAVTEEATPAGQTAGGGQPSKPSAGAVLYFRLPIGLSLRASFAQLLKLMNAFQDFPRLIAVKQLSLSPISQKGPGGLSVTLDVQTFVLPKEGQ